MENNNKVSEVFNFPRFGKYLIHDLRNAWSSYGVGLLTLASMPLILYVANILFHNVWDGVWTSPSLSTRMSLFVLALLIFTISFPSRIYGNLTSKKEGSDYLMIPASRLEKFVSMLAVCLIAVPICYLGVYLLEDALLTLVDPTYTQSLAGANFDNIVNNDFVSDSDFSVGLIGGGYPAAFVSIAITILVFLLGALCFRKWKIGGTILVLFAIGTVLSLVLGVSLANRDFSGFETFIENHIDQLPSYLNWISGIVNTVLFVLLGAGIYFRLKNLKH